ncbi:helix-turn-helix transcriptional regulator [Paenibacillus harenae]|uniref:helix-turn-helix transcriptional regulator n=1 Tax=Paenibacillus harenae TaxID=306543 RepID=UPI000422F52E|nr:helix-turn-helix transcriptional regulator [Paenibacillus harenae]
MNEPILEGEEKNVMKIKVKDTNELNKMIVKKGFNKTEFGNEIDLSHSMTNQITNGKSQPSPKTAKRICEVLECAWEEIFTFESEDEK